MKKVLYISYDGMTDQLGQSQVIPYVAGLSKMGYEFTIISFEKKEKYITTGPLIQSLLEKNGIKWHPEIFSRNPPILAKIYDIWKMNRAIRKLHKEQKFSFTHCRSYVPASAGLRLFKRSNIPFLFDMRGFWVDERIDNGQWDLKKPLYRFFYNYYKKKENLLFRKSVHIISLTWKGKDELVTKFGINPEKITVIPCCVDLKLFDFNKISREAVDNKKKELKIKDDTKVLSYLGAFGGWYLLNEMFDFFKKIKIKYPGIKFLIITQNPPEEVVKQAVKGGADANDIIVKASARADVPLYLALSNWSIFFIKNGYSKIASSPTKLGEIMAMGIPVICNDVGDAGKIIQEGNTGLVIPEFSDREYSSVISRLDELSSLRKEAIRDSAIKNFDLDMGVQSYSDVYCKIG